MTTERQKMKEEIEFVVRARLGMTDEPGARDSLANALSHRLIRASQDRASCAGSFEVVEVHQLSREQSRAVRMVTATAQNGGSVPGTMEEVDEGLRPILGGSNGSWFVAARKIAQRDGVGIGKWMRSAIERAVESA